MLVIDDYRNDYVHWIISPELPLTYPWPKCRQIDLKLWPVETLPRPAPGLNVDKPGGYPVLLDGFESD